MCPLHWNKFLIYVPLSDQIPRIPRSSSLPFIPTTQTTWHVPIKKLHIHNLPPADFNHPNKGCISPSHHQPATNNEANLLASYVLQQQPHQGGGGPHHHHHHHHHQAVSRLIPAHHQKELQCGHYILPTGAGPLDYATANLHLWDPAQVVGPAMQTVYPANNNNNNNKKQRTAAKTLAVLLQRRMEIISQLESIVSKQTPTQMKVSGDSVYCRSDLCVVSVVQGFSAVL